MMPLRGAFTPAVPALKASPERNRGSPYMTTAATFGAYTGSTGDGQPPPPPTSESPTTHAPCE
jgi:hypothetical protein